MPGRPTHDGVRDFLCGSPGEFSYLSCPGCHLIWMSPQPAASVLVELYEQYYGSAQLAPEPEPQVSGVKAWVRAAVLAAGGCYPVDPRPGVVLATRAAGLVLDRVPWIGRRAGFGLGLMLPPYRARGRLLDVGCGYGWYVRLLQNLGWDAIGVEADRSAAAIGRTRYRARILEGTLEDQRLEAESFDAIATRHSIEHVPDPRQTLLECHRLLKPGGWLGVATPNGRSLASRLFGCHWRGLSAPWHLHLLNPNALRRLLTETGFEVRRVRTTAVSAHWVYCASRAIRSGHYDPCCPVGSSRAFQALEALANAWAGDLGEELEATAVATAH
jgi:SAM-dependent methyltransferase